MEHVFSEQKIGVLALGAFVGFLLAYGLMKSGPTLKAVLTVIGAALGGTPIVFLTGSSAKWIYPVGLVLGSLWVHMLDLRTQLSGTDRNRIKQRRLSLIFAWSDFIIIIAISLCAVGYSLISTYNDTLIQKGFLNLTENGKYDVYYPMPFQSTPELVFPSGTNNPEHFAVVEQRPDGFRVEIGGGFSVGTPVNWVAQGVPKKQ